jgi:transposase-like protein
MIKSPIPKKEGYAMHEDSVVSFSHPDRISIADPLTEVLRAGARRLLAEAVEAEVAAFIEEHADLCDGDGRRRVVRHGYMPARSVQTGIGPVDVRRPRVRDRQPEGSGGRIRFTSSILPPYLRRARSVEELLPWLYLKGISTGDFAEALAALLGPDAPGLSASTITRLKAAWAEDYERWTRRDLSAKRYVYLWADGIYFRPRLDHDKQCLLVIIGADEVGNKDIVGLSDGYRESTQSWLELLHDLKRLGLSVAPELAIGDGALGFWNALRQVYGQTAEQRCWVHKTANVLNKLPKSLQAKAKGHLQEIWMAETRADAEVAFDFFAQAYGAKYDKAVACLAKDRDRLLTFYDFPAEHWRHVRSTNPIESTFANVRLRTSKTKGYLSRKTALTMVFKLLLSARKKWRRLNGSDHLAEVIQGVKFEDGIKQIQNAA